MKEGKTPEPATLASCEPPRIAPNLFPEQSTVQALTALRASSTLEEKESLLKRLDEQQQQYIDANERVRRLSQNLAVAEAHTD